MQYVNHVWKLSKVHGNAKSVKKSSPMPVSKDIPLLGPRFTPPRYFHQRKRQYTAIIKPDTQYLRPVTVIHPVYFEDLAKCPICGSANVAWDSWNATGPCEVHGTNEEETAIGYQLWCTSCHKHAKDEGDGRQYCFATTSVEFWQKYEHWEIPCMCPSHSWCLLLSLILREQVTCRSSSAKVQLLEIFLI